MTTESTPNLTGFAAGSASQTSQGSFTLPEREGLIDREVEELEQLQNEEPPPPDEKEQRIIEGLLGLTIFVVVSTSAFLFFQNRLGTSEPSAQADAVAEQAPLQASPQVSESPKELDGIPLKPAISDGWFSDPTPSRPKRMIEPPEM